MRFGPVPLNEALGGILAHGVRAGGTVVKKGTVLGETDLALLAGEGVTTVTVAMMEAGDIAEDRAALTLAKALSGAGVHVEAPFTGRVNLFAEVAGLIRLDRDRIHALNAIDEAVTFATLPALKPVVEGEMIGTVKIIPYAVPQPVLDHALKVIAAAPLLSVAPYQRRRVHIISTRTPGFADKVIEKTLRVTADRLAPMGAAVTGDVRIPHAVEPLADALQQAEADLVVVFGASAITDRRDVIPAALEAAGGRIEHLGMPVDPGNLLMVGERAGIPVLGAPGCARSPKENGFDWVLARLMAGIPVTRADITAMGVGGLLMEIVTRPQPRAGTRAEAEAEARPKIRAVILAAGQGSRMGGPTKVTLPVEGVPMVRRAVEAALGAGLVRPVVVVGHRREEIAAVLFGADVQMVENLRYAEGLSTSLKAGLEALDEATDAALIMLADMPRVDASLVRQLADAYRPDKGALVVVPVAGGRRGNPVIWSRRFFRDLMAIEGDTGAKGLIGQVAEAVVEVPVEGEAALLDIDTPEAFATLR